MCVPVHASQSSELQSSHTVPGVRINYTSVRRPVLSFPRAIYRPEGFGQTFGRDEAQKSSFLFPIAILNAVVTWKHLIGLAYCQKAPNCQFAKKRSSLEKRLERRAAKTLEIEGTDHNQLVRNEAAS